jgi:hypothetical protein
MTQIIYKYPLKVQQSQIIEVPQGGQILTFQAQQEVPTLWIQCDKDAPTRPMTFLLLATGEEFIMERDAETHLDYVGTCQLFGGSFVYHLFLVHQSFKQTFRDILLERLKQDLNED